MDPRVESASPRFSFRGKGALIVAVVVAIVLAVWLRWAFLIICGIGVIVASGLYLWHKWRPLKEEEISNKKPLGLE
jgi:FtsH-binding integral membrane protein